MAKIRITTAFNIDLEFETAEVYHRLFAWMIDFAILYSYALLAGYLLRHAGLDVTNHLWVHILLIYLPFIFYHPMAEILFNGQSIGKMIFKLKVISLNGDKPRLSQYLLRWCFRLIDIAASLGLCAVISIGVSKRNQRLGDLVAGTVVVRLKPVFNTNELIYIPVEENDYQLLFPEVMQLSDRDILSIKNLLTTNQKRKSFEAVAYYATRVKSVLQIDSEMPPEDFLQKLLEDYNYMATR